MSFAWVVLVGCGSSSVSGVDSDAIHVRVEGDEVLVAGEAASSLILLNADPQGRLDPALKGKLQAHQGRPAWIELPPSTLFLTTRRVVNSALAANVGPVVLSSTGGTRAVPLGKPPRYGLAATCPDGPRQVEGVEPLVTLSIQRGPEGAWLFATARYLPVLEHGGGKQAVDGLPNACLAIPPCERLFSDPELVSACQGGEMKGAAPGRVTLGGPSGCFTDLAADLPAIERWPVQVAERVGELALGERPLIVVMPEAQVPHAAVVAVLDGFTKAKARPVSVGTTLLIQGNDGPPRCDAPVRSAQMLASAGARWLGALRGQQAATEP